MMVATVFAVMIGSRFRGRARYRDIHESFDEDDRSFGRTQMLSEA